MHTFTTTLEWKGGARIEQRTEGRPPIAVSSPPAFGGDAGCWTPEDFLVAAVESCVLLTTLYFVQRNKIGLRGWTSRCTGEMAKTAEGLRFQRMELSITARVAAETDVEALRRAVTMAEHFCPLSAAVKFPVAVALDAVVDA